MFKISTLWKANVIAFTSSFCVMVIELVAARILAPQIGISLYTWTSIIGVILAGIALGNYIGGKIADKYASPSLLVIVLFAGTLMTMAVLPIAKAFSSFNWFYSLPLMLNSTLRVTFIFFLPAIILSMVSPMVIKLTLADLGKTGGVVGTIYACSTAGAILGTFMTGFYLIYWFGTSLTVWLVIAVLLITGIVVWLMWKIPRRWSPSIQNIVLLTLLVLIIICSTLLFSFRESWQHEYARESNYYTIQLQDTKGYDPVTGEKIDVKIVTLDHLVHNFAAPEDPNYLGYRYLKIFAKTISYHTGADTTPIILHLGGGAYSLPRYIEHNYPGSTNDVVEIDPVVTEVAYDELGLSRETSVTTYNQDARIFLSRHNGIQGKYDLVIGDVYNDVSVPYHLTTLEYNKLVEATMKPDGMYLSNIIDNYYIGSFLPHYIHTVRQVFEHVYLFSSIDFDKSYHSNTFVVAATNSPIDLDNFNNFIEENYEYGISVYIQDEKELDQYLIDKEPLLLTDDYAPTDVLVTPLLNPRDEHMWSD
jgi:MFS family permease